MASRASVRGPLVAARWAVPVLALMGVAGALAAVTDTGVRVTTYAETSPVAFAADLLVGLGLAGSGLALWWVRRGGAAVLAVLIGCAWSAAEWTGREEGPAVLRSVGMVAATFLLPVLAHLVVAWPGGHPLRARGRAAVCAAYVVATVVAVGEAVFRAPLFDRYCWRNCSVNTFLVHADIDVAHGLAALRLTATTIGGILLVFACAWQCLRTSRAARQGLVPVLVPAAGVAAAESGYALLLLTHPAEDPTAGAFAAVHLVRAAALTFLAVGLIWVALRSARMRRAVGRLAQELSTAPVPGGLRDALARSLGDPRLSVAYWLADPGRFIDSGGNPVDVRRDEEGAVTTITRSGRPVAVVLHSGEAPADRDLPDQIGSAARLAVDNERLRAEVLYRLTALRASQERLVTRSDAVRRRLERDLHDGAQQRLLAVAYALRQALDVARTGGDAIRIALLEEATAITARALTELRELAHGIFPAILTDAGLCAALRTLAETADVPVDVSCTLESRVVQAAETAAYAVAVEAIAGAARRSAGYVSVCVERHGPQLALEVCDDGPPHRPADLVHVADRVGALGGRLDVAGARLRAEIPCG